MPVLEGLGKMPEFAAKVEFTRKKVRNRSFWPNGAQSGIVLADLEREGLTDQCIAERAG